MFFSDIDRHSYRESYSNLDPTGSSSTSSANAIDRLNILNAKATALAQEASGLDAQLQTIDSMSNTAYAQAEALPSINNVRRTVQEGIRTQEQNNKAPLQARLNAINNIELPAVKKQIADLNAALPVIAKSDPVVIKALSDANTAAAQAQTAVDQAKLSTSTKKTWLYIGAAAVLLVVVGWIATRVIGKVKE